MCVCVHIDVNVYIYMPTYLKSFWIWNQRSILALRNTVQRHSQIEIQIYSRRLSKVHCFKAKIWNSKVIINPFNCWLKEEIIHKYKTIGFGAHSFFHTSLEDRYTVIQYQWLNDRYTIIEIWDRGYTTACDDGGP